MTSHDIDILQMNPILMREFVLDRLPGASSDRTRCLILLYNSTLHYTPCDPMGLFFVNQNLKFKDYQCMANMMREVASHFHSLKKKFLEELKYELDALIQLVQSTDEDFAEVVL